MILKYHHWEFDKIIRVYLNNTFVDGYQIYQFILDDMKDNVKLVNSIRTTDEHYILKYQLINGIPKTSNTLYTVSYGKTKIEDGVFSLTMEHKSFITI